MADYRISTQGLDEIKKSEALSLKAYQDTGGVWTIGYGHTGKVGGVPVGSGMTITKDQAEKLLQNDVSIFENAIKKGVKVPLTQNQYDALVNFSYNIGDGAFLKSTLLRRLNQGDYQAAADQMLRWNKDNGEVIQGLTNRRERERAMFLGQDYTPGQRSNVVMPTDVDELIDAPIIKPQSIANTLTSNFAPAETSGGFTDAFNQLNNTLNPLGAVEPETQPNKSQYQNQLAQAFGVSPDTKAGLPDYIGDLVKSIYDPA
ncbi:lysozyme [Haemophilus parahaemolyticus]|uniref:lysozyme n=1 Tax=Haemophilus parahaemolyticus TaxID=735 RepID=UPI00352E7322